MKPVCVHTNTYVIIRAHFFSTVISPHNMGHRANKYIKHKTFKFSRGHSWTKLWIWIALIWISRWNHREFLDSIIHYVYVHVWYYIRRYYWHKVISGLANTSRFRFKTKLQRKKMLWDHLSRISIFYLLSCISTLSNHLFHKNECFSEM